mgnify:CR=1 FL=1
MVKVFGKLNNKGRLIYLETVFIDDAVRLAADGVYRTFKGDYTNLIFKVVED